MPRAGLPRMVVSFTARRRSDQKPFQRMINDGFRLSVFGCVWKASANKMTEKTENTKSLHSASAAPCSLNGA
ncbi:hypothetical protein CDV36_016544 [Fusarium kuroshium]|uniref:Uncharacterized protein n=1 Tax=Fusarium kuroshium TaxID=2010991 RepID=A0A3M2QLC5_9HYPO|nr:hypothetical protein CDV36_016544 [Fusarium kuroshium]